MSFTLQGPIIFQILTSYDVFFSGFQTFRLSKKLANMQNEEGQKSQNMDLYIPRKCSATNRLITSKDHASVKINIWMKVADMLVSFPHLPSVVLSVPREMLTVTLIGCGRRRNLKSPIVLPCGL
ncbi:hypothetical protein LXL04_007679 [Taraxacum kok-saghyz]